MTDDKRERAADALGMTVPPVWAARGATWLRSALGRVHAHMAPGFSVVLERLFGIVDNKALYCAVELAIPDLLADGPRSAAEIATAASADADAVDRLLRYLVSRDLFSRSRDGRYGNNAATAASQRPRFRLALAADQGPVEPEPHIAIRPKGGLHMVPADRTSG